MGARSHTGARIAGPLSHQDSVVHAAFSADGTGVVTASFDKTAPGLGRLYWREGHRPAQEQVLRAAFSADGTRVVTASKDTTAVVSDARTGQKIAGPLSHQDSVVHATFSADGTGVVTCRHFFGRPRLA